MRSLLSVAAVAAVLSASPALADTPFTGKTGALTYAVDSGRSQFKFLSTAPMERIPGTADGISGEIKVADAANPGSTSGRIVVPVAKMRTGNDMRDKHLQSAEWLNAAAHPNITFDIESVRITKVDGAKASGTARGRFTVNGKGVAKEVPIELTVAASSIKVNAVFKVSLKDHDVKGKEGTVGSKVGETIDVDATLYALAR